MPKVWKVLPKKSDDLIEQLLINRHITSSVQKEKFLNPNLNDFKKDLAIPGISSAVKRIQKAIDVGEQIVVYGDYDVDGVCASAVVYLGLTSLGAKILPYLPHREKEGYGLSRGGLEFVRDSGATLVITVDNGIVAIEQAKFAKELGLDLIITDHHQPLEKKPEAFEIVHTTSMCGAAVAWCLIKELIKPDLAQELLQYVAIATVCDMMSLLGVNRSLVKEGLKVLNKTKSVGLRELFIEGKLEMGSITSYDLGHIIGPRINAMGRLEHAIDALRLLCTKDSLKAKRLVQLISDTNLKRKLLTTEAVDGAKLKIDASDKKQIYILGDKNWVPGIIGLVAARVCEEYQRPAIALSIGEVYAKGSARSVEGVNIIELIRGSQDILVEVGGHAGAAGFTIEVAKIDEFIVQLEKGMSKLKLADAQPTLAVEAEVPTSQLTKTTLNKLSDFEPFGLDNPRPVLSTRNMVISNIKTVGADSKHLKFVADGIEAIAFSFGDLASLLTTGQLVNLAYELDLNRFNGSETLQLKVKDIKIA